MPIILSFSILIILFFAGCVTKDKPSIDADYREDHTIKDYFYLGLNYYKQGEYDWAISEYSRELISNPDSAMAYYHRAAAYSHKSRYDMTVSDYDKAIDIDPKFAEGFYNLGTIYTEQGQIEISPKLAEAFYNRGNIHYGKGNYDMAVSDYTKAIEVHPRNTMVYINRGDAYREKGLCKEAILDFTKAIEMNPDDAHAYNEKSWILATCADDRYRDGEKAVALAKKAIDISSKPLYMNTLGAAYAEAGKFENAIATQEEVIVEIIKINADKNLVDGCIERLKFYKANKPWREIR
jgi:tetratricopeptide (TPR) repeat protein